MRTQKPKPDETTDSVAIEPTASEDSAPKVNKLALEPFGALDRNDQPHCWQAFEATKDCFHFERHIDFYADSGYSPDLQLRAVAALDEAFSAKRVGLDERLGVLTNLPTFDPANRLILTVQVVRPENNSG